MLKLEGRFKSYAYMGSLCAKESVDVCDRDVLRYCRRYWKPRSSKNSYNGGSLVQLHPENADTLYNGISSSNTPVHASIYYPSSSNIRSQLVMKISHPKPVFLLLAMAPGTYPVEMYDHQKRLHKNTVNVLENWMLTKKLGLHSAINPRDLNLENNPALKQSYFVAAPLLFKSLDKFRLFLRFSVCQHLINDIITKAEKSGLIPFIPRLFYRDLQKIIQNIFTGQYRHSEAVPYFDIPLIYNCLTSLHEVYEDIRSNVGPEVYDKFKDRFLNELMDWIEWHKLSQFTFHGSSHYHGQQTDLDRLRHYNGRGAALELIQLLHGASLDASIRNSKSLRLFFDTGVVLHSKCVELHYQSLDQSKADIINDTIVDFQKISTNLKREYAKDEVVLRFVKNTEIFVDGAIRAMANDWNEKSLEGQIVQVWKVDT